MEASLDVESFGPQRYPYADVELMLPAMLIAFGWMSRHAREGDRAVASVAVVAGASAILSRIATGRVALITTLKFLTLLLLLNVVCVMEIVAMKKKPATLEREFLSQRAG